MQKTLDITDDNAVLRACLTTRWSLVQELCPDGNMPKDKDDRQILLATLSGMERVALGNKRIASENEQTDKMEKVRAIIEGVLKHSGGRSLIVPTGGGSAPNVTLPKMEVLEGELRMGDDTERYDDFQARVKPLIDAKRELEA